MNKKVLRELIYTDISEEALDDAKKAIDEALNTKNLEVRYDAIIRARGMLEEAEAITYGQIHM